VRESRSGRRLWPALAAPGTLWLLALFAVPFYAIAAVAFGYPDPIFRSPVPEWDPRYWDFTLFTEVVQRSLTGDLRPVFVRTLLFVGLALLLCFLIGYPVAYYLARYAGRRRGLLLALILAPWWINYITRMLAWLSLLQDDGYVNDALIALRIVPDPVRWLSGNPYTVVLALVYGYVPFFIVPLYATLDRIDSRLLDASRDLGVGGFRTFLHVTLPGLKHVLIVTIVLSFILTINDFNIVYVMTRGGPGTATQVFATYSYEVAFNQLRWGRGVTISIFLVPVLVVAIALVSRYLLRDRA